jgi:Holliday junction resolvase RusA-like endonuclease
MTLTFTVYGVAQSMGSKRAFVPKGWNRPIITDTNRNLKQWQLLVADGASQAIASTPTPWTMLEGGVRLTVAFHLPRPKSLKKSVTAHTKAIDLDKAVRAVGDALTRIVYRDDAQVCELVAAKCYAAPGESPHVTVRVEPTAGVQPVRVPLAPLPLFAEERNINDAIVR